jgi:hypothetical protein
MKCAQLGAEEVFGLVECPDSPLDEQLAEHLIDPEAGLQ